MKKIAVVASGGNSPGMNNCLQGVARACQVHGVHLVVIHDGFAGIVARNFSVYQPGPQLIDYLYAQSGVVFSGSGRFEEMKTLPVQQQVVQILSETGIEGLIVIGGNGSYRGAVALSRLGVKCIALPGTIDNDITTTDFTIGFPTASEFLLNFLDRLRDCAESQKYCFVVEVMGRHCGDLAIYAGIAGLVDFIVTKTNYQKPASIIQRVQQWEQQGRRSVVVVVAEHLYDAQKLVDQIDQVTSYHARLVVPGYGQRGGRPVLWDRFYGWLMGVKAVQLLLDGKHEQELIIRDADVCAIPFGQRKSLSATNFLAIYEKYLF